MVKKQLIGIREVNLNRNYKKRFGRLHAFLHYSNVENIDKKEFDSKAVSTINLSGIEIFHLDSFGILIHIGAFDKSTVLSNWDIPPHKMTLYYDTDEFIQQLRANHLEKLSFIKPHNLKKEKDEISAVESITMNNKDKFSLEKEQLQKLLKEKDRKLKL